MKIRLRLDHIITDRTEYKPYIAQLSGQDTYVEIDIPDKEVLEDDDTNVVITANGLAAVLGTVANSIDKMHEDYKKKKFGGY